MSFDLPLGIAPFSSAPSETSTPLSSGQSGNEQFDQSQSSQSSRIVTVDYGSSGRIQRYLIVSKIEEIFAKMIDVLAEGGDTLVIPYRSGRSQAGEGVLRFPGSTVNEAIKFTRMMRIMELAREALMSDRIISKRNIYYQDPDLFVNQRNVDALVDSLALTLGVAASKGLIAGSLTLTMRDDTVVSCLFDQDPGESIPPTAMIKEIDFGDTRWVLVVEKEATFRTLAASQYWRDCIHGQGIIITGKGYADLATIEFLSLVHSLRPLMPILGVFDSDPHGIQIMRTYKNGSRRLSHEQNARVPGLQWIGVRIEDVLRAGPPGGEEDGSQSSSLGQSRQSSQSSFGQSSQESQGSALFGKQTPRDAQVDLKTAQGIVMALAAREDELDHEETEQLREIQMMLLLNVKAEIQAIDNMGDLSDWLDEKIGLA
ncbi:hypothetical protein KVR01_009078 [Diaporthe batatas]|uniref:uncharacterized protein n=1 Tax=Diaporthe batatas TaxID=748121 RepID=UPI001D037669|nr:uncharacterized protein KVR01_009078 [Diaporthe batatas]KAG8160814.1 hypothetical protein KVR01_009078 [Diaporthe batatas]